MSTSFAVSPTASLPTVRHERSFFALLRTTVLAGLVVCLWPAALGAQVVVKAKTMHTMAGDVIADGVVVVVDGKITAVGPESRVDVPAGLRTLETEVLTPGFIDVRSTLGLSGAYNSNVGPVRDQDQLETSSPMQPELRAIDAYNPREELIEYARRFGVTTLHTGHGPGAIISGQTFIAKTRGDTVEDAMVEPVKMLAVSLSGLSSQFKTPGTRPKGVAMLRGALFGAQEYAEKRAASEGGVDEEGDEGEGKTPPAPPRQLSQDVLADVLAGEITLMIRANSATDIAAALRLQREFGFELVIDGGAEAYLMLDELEEAGVPVFLHPARARLANKTFEIAKILRDAGIPFAVQTGHEGYVPKTRVLVWETAHYAAHGLEHSEALAAITIDSAKLLGIDERVGSLEVGKDGDLVLFDGDPFEYLTKVCGVVIEGEVMMETCQ